VSGRRGVSLTGIPHMGRATLFGMAIGWIFVAGPVLIGMLALGADGDVILFASHVGFFGGMGFGGMLGAVIQADRFERGSLTRVVAVPADRPPSDHDERVDHAA
jgi:hypothetical protein